MITKGFALREALVKGCGGIFNVYYLDGSIREETGLASNLHEGGMTLASSLRKDLILNVSLNDPFKLTSALSSDG